MAKVLVDSEKLTNIANAIREKNVETISYKVNEMANAIENISTSGGAAEDLSNELSTQNSLITTQETTIDNIITALEGKASGGSGTAYETCNVHVNVSPSTIPYQIIYSIVNDNQKMEILETESKKGTTDIVCIKGTPITIAATTGGSFEPVIQGDSSNEGVHFTQYQWTNNDTVIFGIYWIDCDTQTSEATIGMNLTLSLD